MTEEDKPETKDYISKKKDSMSSASGCVIFQVLPLLRQYVQGNPPKKIKKWTIRVQKIQITDFRSNLVDVILLQSQLFFSFQEKELTFLKEGKTNSNLPQLVMKS